MKFAYNAIQKMLTDELRRCLLRTERGRCDAWKKYYQLLRENEALKKGLLENSSPSMLSTPEEENDTTSENEKEDEVGSKHTIQVCNKQWQIEENEKHDFIQNSICTPPIKNKTSSDECQPSITSINKTILFLFFLVAIGCLPILKQSLFINK